MKKLKETPNQLIDSINLDHRVEGWNKRMNNNDAKNIGEGIARCVTLTSLNLVLASNPAY